MQKNTQVTAEEIVTDAELNKVFDGKNFGDKTNREVVLGALKKVAQGWHNGSTSRYILAILDLIWTKNEHDGLSDKGLEYLLAASLSKQEATPPQDARQIASDADAENIRFSGIDGFGKTTVLDLHYYDVREGHIEVQIIDNYDTPEQSIKWFALSENRIIELDKWLGRLPIKYLQSLPIEKVVGVSQQSLPDMEACIAKAKELKMDHFISIEPVQQLINYSQGKQ